MTFVHIFKLLKPSPASGNWYRKPNHLAYYVSRRHVQEFPEAKLNNESHVDHLVVLPESLNETADNNETLRLPKSGEPELDFSKLSTESVYKGLNRTILSFENFIADFKNEQPEAELKPLQVFLKDLENHLYPMESAFNIYMSLLVSCKHHYDFKEFHELLNRYGLARGQIKKGLFKMRMEDYVSNEYYNSSDIVKKLLRIYHPAKPGHRLSFGDDMHFVTFSKNLKDDIKSYSLKLNESNKLFSHTVDDPDTLAAISTQFELCQELHHKERTPLKITDSTYSKFMQVCPDRFVRRMLWQTRNKRCSPKGVPKFNNLANVDSMRVLRRKISNLQGYRTHVEFRMDGAMAKSKQQVLESLQTLQQENSSKLEERLEELNDFVDNDIENPDEALGSGGIQAYDVDYWSHKFKYDVLIGKSDAELRSYFPFECVMKGLMSYFDEYLGIKMRVKSGSNKFWDDSVRLIEVLRNDELLGSIIHDPFHRSDKLLPGTFSGHIRGRNRDLDCLPLRLISTSFWRDQASGQVNLSLSDITGLFGCFSAAIQRLLYNYDYSELNLEGALEIDANNLLPNLCVGHFLTDYRILQSCSDRGGSKPIDAELASRLIKSITYFNPLTNWYGLYMAHLDLEAHTSITRIKKVVSEVYPIYSPFPRDPDDFDYCAMPDIFMGPNDGCKYASFWSKQLANFCLQHSQTESGSSDKGVGDVVKLREFNSRLLDTLFTGDKVDTSQKLLSLTGRPFQHSETGIGVL